MNKISQTIITVAPQTSPDNMYRLIKQCVAVSVLMDCEVQLEYEGTTLYLNPGSDATQCYRNFREDFDE